MKEIFEKNSVNRRIMLIMNEKKFTKNSLAKQLGLSQPALAKIENNENLPSFKLLFEFLRLFPDVSADWLITGEGEKLKDTTSTQANDGAAYLEIIKSQQETISYLIGQQGNSANIGTNARTIRRKAS